MPRFLIRWGLSHGDENVEVIEAETEDEAVNHAYALVKEDFESQASYQAELLTKEEAENHGFDWDEEEASYECEDIGCDCTKNNMDSQWEWNKEQGVYICSGCAEIQ